MGSHLFSVGWNGRSIFNLLHGLVAVYALLEDGRRQIVQFATPGAVLGMCTTNGGETYVGAQALTDICVSVIPMSVLISQSHSEPKVGMRLALSLAGDCNLAFEQLTNIGRRSARERVAYLLCQLYVRIRMLQTDPSAGDITLPITQEQIGDATGLTFIHVNRILSTLRNEGVVELKYRRLKVLDIRRLQELAGVDQSHAFP